MVEHSQKTAMGSKPVALEWKLVAVATVQIQRQAVTQMARMTVAPMAVLKTEAGDLTSEVAAKAVPSTEALEGEVAMVPIWKKSAS